MRNLASKLGALFLLVSQVVWAQTQGDPRVLVKQAGAVTGQVLRWNGTTWDPSNNIATASNGLTATGENIKAGGNLVENTVINGKSSYALTLDSMYTVTIQTRQTGEAGQSKIYMGASLGDGMTISNFNPNVPSSMSFCTLDYYSGNNFQIGDATNGATRLTQYLNAGAYSSRLQTFNGDFSVFKSINVFSDKIQIETLGRIGGSNPSGVMMYDTINKTVFYQSPDILFANFKQNLSLTGQSLGISGGAGVTLPIVGVTAGAGISVSTTSGTATITNTQTEVNGIYTGSGTIPNNTNATATDDFTITTVDNTGTQSPKFRVVASGTDPGVQVWKVGNDSLQLSYIGGEATLEAIGTSGDFWITSVGNDLRLGSGSTGVFTHATKNVLGGYLALPYVQTASSITVSEGTAEIDVVGTSGTITLTFDNTSNLLGSAAKTITVRNRGAFNVTLSRGSQSWEWSDMTGTNTASNQTLAAGETGKMLWVDAGVTDYYVLHKMPATFTGGSTNLAVTGSSSPLTLTSDTGTDVTFTAGTNVTLAGTSGNITISAAGGGDILNGGNSAGGTVTIGTNDNNVLSLETNNVTRLSIANGTTTGGIITATNVNANTSSPVDALILSTNSTGTGATGFGTGILFKAESNTTNDRDVARITGFYTDATNATSSTALTIDLKDAGTFAETYRFEPLGNLKVGQVSPTSFGKANITSGVDFTVGNSANLLTLGGSTGLVTMNSSASGSAVKINASGTSSYIEVGGTTASTITSGNKSNMDFPQGFTASSGTGNMNNIILSGTINQSGTATGELAGLHVNHTITAGVNYRGVYIDADGGTNSKGIYQTGSSMTNNFVGKTFFGATTSPTAMLHLGAGTTTLAPLKFTSGTNLTTPEAGAIEWNGTNLFVTQTSGPTRKQIAYTTDITGGATNLAITGTSSPLTLTSDTGTDVTLTAGTGVSLTGTSGNVTINNTGIVTEVDGSVSNELQTVANTSDATSHTVTLSNSGGSTQFVEGSGIILTTTGTSGAGIVTIASSGGSGDIVNGGNTTGPVVIGTNNNSATSLETNNVTRLSIASGASTGGQTTLTTVTANTTTADDALTITTSSSGTPANGFGTGILFTAENATVSNSQLARIKPYYIDANNNSSVSALSLELSSGGSLSERFRFETTAFGTLKIGSQTPASLTNTGITSTAPYYINNTGSQVTQLGGGTGNTFVQSGNAIGIGSTGNGAVTIGSSEGGILENTLTTAFQFPVLSVKHGLTVATGGAQLTSILVDPTINQTGDAFGVARGLRINPTLTSLLAAYRSVDIGVDNSLAKGIYQTGTSTTNNFVGKTFFGSTSAPTALLQVAAGSTTVAPVILTSGTNLTTPVAGAIEWNGTNLFATQTSGPTRRTVAFTSDIGSQTIISPSQLTAAANDWNPTDLATATVIRLSGDNQFRIISGITAPAASKELTLANVGTFAVLISREDAASSAANRLAIDTDIPLYPGHSIVLWYDVTSSRWRLKSKTFSDSSVPEKQLGAYFRSTGSVTNGDYDHWLFTGSTLGVTPTSTRIRTTTVSTGATSNGLGSITTKGASIFEGTTSNVPNSITFKTVVSVNNLSDAGQTFTAECGWSVSTAIPSDGASFRYSHGVNGGKWLCVTRLSGAETTTDSGATVAADTPDLLEIYHRPDNSVAFFVNGSFVAEHTTNIYNSTATPSCVILKSVGTTARLLAVDIIQFSESRR